MRDEPPPPFTDQVHSQLERLAGRGVLRVGIAAFVVGVLLHACVIYAVLDDGGDASGSGEQDRPAVVVTVAAAATAVPTRPPDRNTCDAIRGTDYRSETERQFFITNCR